MYSVVLAALIISAVLGCTFALCEWVVGGRRSTGRRGSRSSPDLAGFGPDAGEASQMAARRRLARRLEHEAEAHVALEDA